MNTFNNKEALADNQDKMDVAWHIYAALLQYNAQIRPTPLLSGFSVALFDARQSWTRLFLK